MPECMRYIIFYGGNDYDTKEQQNSRSDRGRHHDRGGDRTGISQDIPLSVRRLHRSGVSADSGILPALGT